MNWKDWIQPNYPQQRDPSVKFVFLENLPAKRRAAPLRIINVENAQGEKRAKN